VLHCVIANSVLFHYVCLVHGNKHVNERGGQPDANNAFLSRYYIVNPATSRFQNPLLRWPIVTITRDTKILS